jgi:hypothetical protein
MRNISRGSMGKSRLLTLVGVVTLASLLIGATSASAFTNVHLDGHYGSVTLNHDSTGHEGNCHLTNATSTTFTESVTAYGPTVTGFMTAHGNTRVKWFMSATEIQTGRSFSTAMSSSILDSRLWRLPNMTVVANKTIGNQLQLSVTIGWFDPVSDAYLGSVFYSLDNLGWLTGSTYRYLYC